MDESLRLRHTLDAGKAHSDLVAVSAPRISPALRAALAAIDDGRLPIAEINRRLGSLAEELGQKRPSYQRVRELVHDLRETAALREPSTVEVVTDVLWRARPPEALLDRLAGIEILPLR